MTTTTTEVTNVEGALVVKYDVTDAAIAELAERYKGITFTTPAAYEEGRKAIGTLRDLRTRIEKRRKDLKADSLAFGRKVDAVARHFTDLVEEIENPLQVAKRAIDDEEARKKREAERAELVALEAKLKAEREEAEAKAAATRAVEEKRLAEERAKLEEKQRILDAQRLEQDELRRKEDERLKAERAKLDADRAAVEAREAEARAVQRREQERVELAAAEQLRAAAAAADAERLAALRPDIDKVHALASDVQAFAARVDEIEVGDASARAALGWARERLEKVSAGLLTFKGGR
jgi:DNA repair exonuclease SbcCD ATPase subunit